MTLPGPGPLVYGLALVELPLCTSRPVLVVAQTEPERHSCLRLIAAARELGSLCMRDMLRNSTLVTGRAGQEAFVAVLPRKPWLGPPGPLPRIMVPWSITCESGHL